MVLLLYRGACLTDQSDGVLRPFAAPRRLFGERPALYDGSRWFETSLRISVQGTALIMLSALFSVGGIRLYMRFLRLLFIFGDGRAGR